MVKIIELIKKEYIKDNIGQERAVEVARSLFAEVKSVTAQEFANGGRIGLKPSIVFVIWATEYQGENTIKNDSVIYTVYRTYKRDDGRLELYSERRNDKH